MMQKTATPQLFLGSRVRKSPFFAATERYGCKAYTIYNHMYMPTYFADGETDYWHLVNHVSLWDVACERQVQITGPDAFAFVRRLTPRNLSKCAVGQCKYVLITDENGGIINDPVLLRLGENHFWLSLADGDVLLWAKGLAVGWGMDVNITEPDVSPLQIQGPKSTDVIRSLFGDWILDLRYYRFKETELNGIPLILSRTGWSNERGYELFLRDSQFGDELWEMIMTAGKPFNIAPGVPNQIKRLEAGLYSYLSDMDLSNNPYEIGLGKFVDLKQDVEFMGKEALKQIKAAGPKQKLVGVEIGGDPLPTNEHHWPAYDQSQPPERIGKLTSCAYSPKLNKNIGYVMALINYAEVGTQLSIEAPWAMLSARVCALPFIDNRAK